ncbi:MAPEG family protein [Chthonobacter albigriseus]|uniref:MAPEG family protein n=1 Tax=Chthonobacter albigriseus TaxID=1683161 RepID=UPI0015EF8C8C|nr:MAPEG family protein [Chthonobacter albigriseus]
MTVAAAAIVLAMVAQMVWTYLTMWRSAKARFRAFRDKRVKGNVKLSQEGWPDDVRALSNNMNNQFETPTLFYALGILALVLNAATVLFAVLAWVYVASRVAHTVVHTTTNFVPHRFRIFLVGYAALIAMTALIAFHTLAALGAAA